MVADSIDELHQFAQQLGLKRNWFQPNTIPHYDLTKNMRMKAVRYGAIEIDDQELIRRVREHRENLMR